MRPSTLFTAAAFGAGLCVSAAAAGRSADSDYWNAFYYPDTTHEVHWISGVADDPASLLEWFRRSHPEIEVVKAGDGVYDLSMPPSSVDEIVEYLQGALGDAEVESVVLQPASFIQQWAPNAELAESFDYLNEKNPRAAGPVFIDPGIRLSSDFTEVGKK